MMDAYDETPVERRQRLAAEGIPDFVDRLIGGLPMSGLCMREVEVLYREYRAYHKNRKPFRWDFQQIGGNTSSTSLLDVLARLHDPRRLSRQAAYELLSNLKAMVAGTLEVPRGRAGMATVG